MTQEFFELNQARALLQKYLNQANDLLDVLEKENTLPDGTINKRAADRIEVFDTLITAVQNFDIKVTRYQQFNPPGAGYQFYKQNFAKAKKYIRALGGNPENIVYYNITDFQ